MAGTIITFYSYKGGTGRSMCVANTAWILASNGMRVLVVDWDLEAPGLHRYFHPFLPDPELQTSTGVIDLIWEFATTVINIEGSDAPGWHEKFARISPYATSIQYSFPEAGTIDFVPAGRQDSLYSTLVSSFDWDNFYDRLGGGGFLEALRRNMSELYDYILVDSRTGLSDIAGICTVQLPNVLVNCFSLSTQAIDGAVSVATSVERQRQDSGIRIFPVPMRVEDGEQDKLDASRDYARRHLGVFLSHLTDPDRYWGDVEVPYKSFYAYEEILATIGDRPRQENTVLATTERIVGYLTEGRVTSLAAPPAEPERRALLARFERGSADISDAGLGTLLGVASPRVFISYEYDSSEHFATVRQLWDLLRRSGVDARIDIPPSQRKADWKDRLASELRTADLVAVVASPNYKREAGSRSSAEDGNISAAQLVAEDYLRGSPGRQFLPVVLPDNSIVDVPVIFDENAVGPIVINELSMLGIEPIIDQVAQYARARAAAELSIAKRDRLLAEQISESRPSAVTQPRDKRNSLSLAQVADRLAADVGRQWATEAAMRRLNDPYPLPVSWVGSSGPLTDRWESLVKLVTQGAGWPASPLTTTWAASPDDLAGTGSGIVEALMRVPTGRLVVLGEPGSGKTMLMIRLVLDLLARRLDDSPVPILADVASWNPQEQPLRSWLTAQLMTNYPVLAAAPRALRDGTTLAEALFDAGLIIPILDGLDQIPEYLRAAAIERINFTLRPGEQLIVTCRSRQYWDTAVGAVAVTLRGAAGIQLRPLDADDVRAYLSDAAAGLAARIRWDPVFAILGTDAPAAQALRTPLMVGLARTIYNPGPGEPAGELRDPAELCSLPNREMVESLLFGAFIPAAYRSDPAGRWQVQKASRWLTFLACRQEIMGTFDIAWWRLIEALPRNALRLIGGIVGGLVGLLAGALAGWVAGGVSNAVVGGLAGSLLLSLLCVRGLDGSFYRLPARGVAWSIGRGALTGLLAGLAAGIGSGLAAGLRTGLIAGLTAGALFAAAGGIRKVPYGYGGATSPGAVMRRDMRIAFIFGIIFGLLGSAAGIEAVFIAGIMKGLPYAAISGFLFGVSAGLALTGSAWPGWTLAHSYLALRRRLPWRFMDFLADAHKRGVLRQIGAIYQFRHILIQKELAMRGEHIEIEQ
jgi:hypothetical protein